MSETINAAIAGRLETQRGEGNTVELWIRRPDLSVVQIGTLDYDDMWADLSDEDLLERNRANGDLLKQAWNALTR